MSAEITVSSAGIERALQAFPVQFKAESVRVMGAFGQQWVADLTQQRMSGRPGVNRRTGNLARSFRSRVYDSAQRGGLVLDASPEGPGAAYANLQEKGGTIRPVKAKYLWIPIAGNLTAAGVARITPTEAITRGGFFAKGIFFGKPIVGRNKATAPAVPLFALKKSVTVHGRLGASALWSSSAPRLLHGLDMAASRVLGGA